MSADIETSGDAEAGPEPTIYFAAIYLVDLRYGGPEEGGWYYDCGELVTDGELLRNAGLGLPTSFATSEEAYQWCKTQNDLLDKTLNTGRRPISSVLSEGQYYAMTHEGELPHYFPARRPRYE